MVYYLGLDLGGTKIEAALVDKRGNILSSNRVLTMAEDGPEKVLNRMCVLLDEVVNAGQLSFRDISGIGMSSRPEKWVIWFLLKLQIGLLIF